MAIKAPTTDQIVEVGAQLGMSLSEDEAAPVSPGDAAHARGYGVVDSMADELPGSEVPARARPPARGRGEPAQRLVLEDRDQGRGGGPARRQAGRHQGQRLRGRRADDERRLGARGLRARGGRHRGEPHSRCRRRDRGQDRVRVPLLLRREPHQRDRAPRPQPLEARPHLGRLLFGLRRGGRGRRRGDGDRRRPGRLDPHPCVHVRHRRPQADARPRALYRRDAHRAHHRSRRPHDRHRRQQRASA